MARAFNEADVRLADGRAAAVDVRKIASGIGYEFIAAQKNLPDAFSPSNQLWIEMAEAAGTKMTAVKQSVVDNVAGIVMKSEIAERVGGATGKPDAAAVIEAVVDGQVKLAYTNPYASSTGLNFLITILATFANGDEDRMLDPDVASAFEQFQKNVPFTALTTLQLRDAIEEGGSIDAFIMEYQTFVNTEDLRSGFEFVPFGVAHDNPLYAVGDAAPDKLEVLTLLASFAAGDRSRDLAREYGFDPPFEYKSSFEVPSGSTLIEAQKLWKERKDAGRPVAAVFVIDVSGSMEGSRMQALRKALVAGSEFISEDSAIGMVLFNDRVRTVLEIEDFDVDHQARFAEAVRAMDPGGGTAMYDGIAVGLDLLVKAQAKSPDVKPLLFVLTDGETNAGHKFDQTNRIIEGLRIPVYTVGFEANVDELARVSSLVEAASLNAGQQNVAFEIGSFFNAQL
jgi:Ca-activated chloride channel family protein